MAESYKNVLGGKLKLKKPGSSGSSSAAAASSGPARGAAAQMASASLAGVKRKAPEPSSVAPTSSSSSSSSSSATADPAVALSDTPVQTIKAFADGKTPAQKAYDEAMKKRQKELASKHASKSHRQKIEEMNEYLAKLPEHNDLFRISYAGTG